RFGEIEQRGVALTPKGRALYDQLLSQARSQLGATPNESNALQYYQILESVFKAFPDDYRTLHDEGLAYFYYQAVNDSPYPSSAAYELNLNSLEESYSGDSISNQAMTQLIEQGIVRLEPIVYEDFLPVSAAGIFQSNLHDDKQSSYEGNSNQSEFEKALGVHVYDELALYANQQTKSLHEGLCRLKSSI